LKLQEYALDKKMHTGLRFMLRENYKILGKNIEATNSPSVATPGK